MIEVDYNEYKETIAENMKLIQTNHKLKEKYYLMKTNASQLAKRIDKAIKYIKENKIEGIDDDGYSDAWFDYVYVRDLLNILLGEDNDK